MLIEDHTMLAFARRWAPYGRAPAAEIWVEFGMPPARFYDHIRRILTGLSSRAMPANERERLEQVAARYAREFDASESANPSDDSSLQ